MNTPSLPPRPFSATEYEAMLKWLQDEHRNGTRTVINLAPDDWHVIAVNDPARVQVQ